MGLSTCRNELRDYQGIVDDCTKFIDSYKLFDGLTIQAHRLRAEAYEKLQIFDEANSDYITLLVFYTQIGDKENVERYIESKRRINNNNR